MFTSVEGGEEGCNHDHWLENNRQIRNAKLTLLIRSWTKFIFVYIQIRRPGSACTVFFFLCRIQNLSQNPKSKIQNPQTPKSKIPKIQNPKSPKSKIQNPQNPKSPKSKIPKIQNPKSEIRKSKIQNPPNPKSKIQNPQNPKSKIPEIWGHIKICYIRVQNPQNRPKKFGFWILDGGFWILDFGPKIQNPKSPKSKIQNPQTPKSQIQSPQNPKSKIRNPQDPKSKIPKIPKIQNLPPKSKIWGVGGLT